MANKLGVINKALALLGESPLTDFDDEKGQAVDTVYRLVKENFLTSHRWRFAVKKAAIAVDATAPLNEWSYRHAVPSDLLMLVRVYQLSQYEIYEDWIYTNASGIEVDYVFDPDEKNYPVYFEWALVNELAYQLSITITNQVGIHDRLQIKARDTMNQAMFKDSQSRPAKAIVHKPYVEVRG